MASANPASGENSRQKDKSKRKPPENVLVVEDDAILAMAIEDTLRDHGCSNITLCSTTKQALTSLSAGAPEAIILDVHLADTDDGWAIAELVTEVSSRPPRIIFSTGAPEEIPARIAELGIVLAKPYAPADLINALHHPRGKGFFGRIKRAFN